MPVPSIEAEEVAPVETEDNQHESRKNSCSVSEKEAHVQPAAAGPVIPEAPPIQSLGNGSSVLERPFNPISLRWGIQYFGLQVPTLRISVEDGEPVQPQQEKQRVDSATTSTAAPNPTLIIRDPSSRHTGPAEEWYSDSQRAVFINYTHDYLIARPPRPLITFYNVTTIAHLNPSMGCLILRQAHRQGLARLVRSTGAIEVYTVGAPPPARRFLDGFGPHWWVAKTPAQVNPGPLAEKADVRNAQRRLDDHTLRKKYMNRELDAERLKTVEGVRRQELSLPMCNDKDEDMEMAGG